MPRYSNGKKKSELTAGEWRAIQKLRLQVKTMRRKLDRMTFKVTQMAKKHKSSLKDYKSNGSDDSGLHQIERHMDGYKQAAEHLRAADTCLERIHYG